MAIAAALRHGVIGEREVASIALDEQLQCRVGGNGAMPKCAITQIPVDSFTRRLRCVATVPCRPILVYFAALFIMLSS